MKKKVTLETEEDDMPCAMASEVALQDQDRLQDEIGVHVRWYGFCLKEFTNWWALHNATRVSINITNAELRAFKKVRNRRTQQKQLALIRTNSMLHFATKPWLFLYIQGTDQKAGLARLHQTQNDGCPVFATENS